MGISVDTDRFLEAYAKAFPALLPTARAGLRTVIGYMNADEHLSDLRHAAYMLATEEHEEARKWTPIEEYGRGRGRPYGTPSPVKAKDGSIHSVAYYGRGRVQLTWKNNYAKADAELQAQYPAEVAEFEARTATKLDLVGYPAQALDVRLSYLIESAGMRQGWFTGKSLSTYINASKTDFHSARRIINGLDRADLIAGYAVKFLACLKSAATTAPLTLTEPEPIVQAPAPKPIGPAATATVSTLVGGAGAASSASGHDAIAIALFVLCGLGVTVAVLWFVWRAMSQKGDNS